jgi:hypothetical protein
VGEEFWATAGTPIAKIRRTMLRGCAAALIAWKIPSLGSTLLHNGPKAAGAQSPKEGHAIKR